jgi:hypothetical protein
MGQPFSVAGAHLKCYVNGTLLGYVAAIPAWNVTSSWGELRELDSVSARQLTPRAYGCSGTIQVIRGRGTGGLEGAELVPSGSNMLLQKYLTIEIQDRITQDVVYRAVQCAIDNQQWQIQRGIVMGTFNFKGISFTNESTQ